MEGWGEAVRCGFWAAEGDGEDDGAGEGSGRAMRSGRKRRKDYLCRTIVMNRVDISDGRRKDCEGAICDVLGPNEFEVVFYDGCSVTLSGEELEEMELWRLANIARNQQILHCLDVEEDLRALAAAARHPAKKKRRDADFVPDEQEAAAPRSPRANPKRAPPKNPARAAAGGGGQGLGASGQGLEERMGGGEEVDRPVGAHAAGRDGGGGDRRGGGGGGVEVGHFPAVCADHRASLGGAPRRGRPSLRSASRPPATFEQFFNFPDEAAALVSPDGALHPLPDNAHKNTKKFYAANAKGGVTKLDPKMLELWRLHTRASASGTAETPPAGDAPPPRAAPPATEDWRSMLGLSLPA
ncbi:hypothetical protein T484DRAFT_3636226 [Baffinella frigidus]|nr:hypothetical protein T484DRAFT_3636226 [Cryptophyta sp. CCMP2293]